jgi:hypothetical protein
MRHFPMLCVFALVGGLTVTAQVLPTSSGSCVVAASGGGCDWVSAISLRGMETSKTTDDSRSALFVTMFKLAPGHPLDSRAIVGGEVLIIGRNNGEIINEKKSPPNRIYVYDGSVMLMSKGEPYLLRNIGKDYLDLLVIEVRDRTPKPLTTADPGR